MSTDTSHVRAGRRPGPLAGLRRHARKATVATAALAIAAGTLAGGAGTASANPIFTVVNADGGVYWRNSPHVNDTDRITGWGVYNGDELGLDCYAWGDPVGPGNTLWYFAVDLSRGPVDPYGNHPSGWVSDHYLNTPGTAANPQPQTLPCN